MTHARHGRKRDPVRFYGKFTWFARPRMRASPGARVMFNFVVAFIVFGLFVALLLLVRARGGEARSTSVWAAQGISLVLVCMLMVAGGFVFKGFVD